MHIMTLITCIINVYKLIIKLLLPQILMLYICVFQLKIFEILFFKFDNLDIEIDINQNFDCSYHEDAIPTTKYSQVNAKNDYITYRIVRQYYSNYVF